MRKESCIHTSMMKSILACIVNLLVFLQLVVMTCGSLPVPLNITVLDGDEGVCLPTDQVDRVKSQIKNDISAVIRNTVAPSILNSSETGFLSCSNIPAGCPSGYYWIQIPDTGNATLQYCDMSERCCNTLGWMRVANLDMTDPNQQCPLGFRLVTSPVRACGRHMAGCLSTTFQTHGIQYFKVCGKITGYQEGTTDAFHFPRTVPIDGNYVDGVSLTHGQSPRKHIWTFAAAYRKTSNSNSLHLQCPCTNTGSSFPYTIPSFIGQDYFCESGSSSTPSNGQIFHQDPLWDGQGCGSTGTTCCSFNNPPWFCKTLFQPTSDDIELRLCGNQGIGDEDVLIESVELYVL